MSKHDATFATHAAFGSERWCAARVGKSLDWFFRNRDRLEAAGFPGRDPVLRLRCKADVDAWIERRRQIRNDVITMEGSQRSQEVNLDAL